MVDDLWEWIWVEGSETSSVGCILLDGGRRISNSALPIFYLRPSCCQEEISARPNMERGRFRCLLEGRG